MANRPEVLSTKNTSPETPMQFAACRNVGRPILAAADFQSAGNCPPANAVIIYFFPAPLGSGFHIAFTLSGRDTKANV